MDIFFVSDSVIAVKREFFTKSSVCASISNYILH